MQFTEIFLAEVEQISRLLDRIAIEKMVALLVEVRESGGRLFVLGVGGSAANASHVVNDFRKIAHLEAYAPTDNIAELTARTNDEGWHTVFESWLRVSRSCSRDALLVLSVGGGDLERQISPNLVTALRYAAAEQAKILGIVGRDGGFTAKMADACVIIPTVHHQRVTPHAEAFQAVVWHSLVSHPALKIQQTKWESGSSADTDRRAVFLDRDGVLNDPVIRDGKPYPPTNLTELRILPGVADALLRLKQGGFRVLVISNQPDVARGTQERKTVEEINKAVRSQLPVDDVFVCYHDDVDLCACRKPRAGLLTTAAGQYDLNLRASYVVGDRWRDIEAGANAGCKTVWIDRSYDEQPPKSSPHAKVSSITAAVDWILADVRDPTS